MKKISLLTKSLLHNNKKGVFGLNAVQQFFAIILGLGLLAYVIVVIMGTLSDSTILPSSSLSASVVNESGAINTSYRLANHNGNILGYASPTIVTIINGSSGQIIQAGNYTVSSGGIISNLSGIHYGSANITYTYNYNTNMKNNANNILTNTSGGISSFFGNVSPVYAILAILVIILVLVVLVRVVTGGEMSRRASEPQL